MSGWRKALLVVIIVFASIATTILALAINTASSENVWPWKLELIRQHSWWSIIILTLVAAVATVVLFLMPQKPASLPPQEDITQSASSGGGLANQSVIKNSTITNSTFYFGTSAPAKLDAEHSDQVKSESPDETPLLMYSFTRHLGLGQWWEITASTMKEACSAVRPQGGALAAECIRLGSVSPESATAIYGIVCVMAADLIGKPEFRKYWRDTVSKLVAVREHHPDVHIILAVVGLVDPEPNESEVRELAKRAGFEEDKVLYMPCDDSDMFSQELGSNVRALLREAHARGQVQRRITGAVFDAESEK